MKDTIQILANYLFAAYGRHRKHNSIELFEQQRNVQLLWLERAASLMQHLNTNGIILSQRSK